MANARLAAAAAIAAIALTPAGALAGNTTSTYGALKSGDFGSLGGSLQSMELKDMGSMESSLKDQMNSSFSSMDAGKVDSSFDDAKDLKGTLDSLKSSSGSLSLDSSSLSTDGLSLDSSSLSSGSLDSSSLSSMGSLDFASDMNGTLKEMMSASGFDSSSVNLKEYDLSDLSAEASEFMKSNAKTTLSGITGGAISDLSEGLWTSSSKLEGMDMTDVNVQYASLMDDLKAQGFGQEYSVSAPTLAKGFATSAREAFDSAYGSYNLASSVKEFEIPSDFDAEAMLNQDLSSRIVAGDNPQDSAVYKAVKNRMSIADAVSSKTSGKSAKAAASAGSTTVGNTAANGYYSEPTVDTTLTIGAGRDYSTNPKQTEHKTETKKTKKTKKSKKKK